MLRREDTPPPFLNRAFVHDRCVDNAQATTGLRSTHDLPFYHPIFFLIVSRVLEKTTPMFIIPIMGKLWQSIKAHQVGRKRG